MTWAPSKGSSVLSSFPRPLSCILVTVGALALSLVIASWVLVSYPIGTTVRGYFYGVAKSEGLELISPPITKISPDLTLNKSLDVDDSKSRDGFQDSPSSPGLSSNTNNPLSSSSSTIPTIPQTKEVNGTEASFPAVPTPKTPRTSDNYTRNNDNVAKDDSPPQSNSQVQEEAEASSASSNVTDVRIDESSLLKNSSFAGPRQNVTSEYSSDLKSATIQLSHEISSNESKTKSTDSGCDLYPGSWVHDSSGPLYTNDSCPVLTQMQNCQGNGRPDKDYENWRWKPFQCDLPRFDPKRFLELMRGKTLAFIGDSVARNQMESMLCILWQVEQPKNRGNRKMQRYYFRSTSTMIVRIWSSWLVKQTSDPLDYAPQGVVKLHLDAPDENLMELIPKFDAIVLSSGHWFAKQSVYVINNEIVGGQLWWPDKSRPMKVNNIEAFGISVETILTALVTHPNYTGLTILRSFSPDHYEGGAWNTGGSCTGKVKPLAVGELVENGFTNIMHEKQLTGFNRAIKKATNKSKLKLMDITESFSYRHDGHPGPYRNPDPNKITKRGPDGRPPPQDCLHWCMPGPVDTWNELVFEIIRRECESNTQS